MEQGYDFIARLINTFSFVFIINLYIYLDAKLYFDATEDWTKIDSALFI